MRCHHTPYYVVVCCVQDRASWGKRQALKGGELQAEAQFNNLHNSVGSEGLLRIPRNGSIN